ncbi:MAG: hypothetical protein D6729_19440 [Deltaproteobacteria bacterium]|nr:MAG: hypothetical protein D6729_19440 [Deltaproteobacteria bacterium]
MRRMLIPLLSFALAAGMGACAHRRSVPEPKASADGQGGRAVRSEWVEVEAEGGFRFELPERPEVEHERLHSSAGPIALTLYVLQTEHAAFNVTFARYPKGFLPARDPAKVLGGARDTAASRLNGRLVSQTDVHLAAPGGEVYPGLEVVVEMKGGLLYRARILIAGDTLVQLSHVAGAGTPGELDYRHLVESLLLVGS